MPNNIYSHTRARRPHPATSLLTWRTNNLTQEHDRPAPGAANPGANAPAKRGGVPCPAAPPPPRSEHSRRWRCVQVRPGRSSEQQSRQTVLFTEGSLRAEGRWAARPLSRSLPAPAPHGPRRPVPLTSAGRASGQWSSPCGNRTSPAPGAPGPARARSGQPRGGAVTRGWRRRGPPGAPPALTHLVQEAEPLESLAVLHRPRHAGIHATARAGGLQAPPLRRPRLRSAVPPGSAIPAPPWSRLWRPPAASQSVCLHCTPRQGPCRRPAPC